MRVHGEIMEESDFLENFYIKVEEEINKEEYASSFNDEIKKEEFLDSFKKLTKDDKITREQLIDLIDGVFDV